MFPSTAKVSMASYEFVLVHHETGRHAGVQVKSGSVGFLKQDVAQDFDVFFVFMANPIAVVAGADPRIIQIGPDEIEAFARRCWALLPRRLQARWPIYLVGYMASRCPVPRNSLFCLFFEAPKKASPGASSRNTGRPA